MHVIATGLTVDQLLRVFYIYMDVLIVPEFSHSVGGVSLFHLLSSTKGGGRGNGLG